MDDILVWGRTIEEHEDRQMAVFDRGRANEQNEVQN